MGDIELSYDGQGMQEYMAAMDALIRMELSAGMRRYAEIAMQDAVEDV
jgi:hypothetical protein